VLQALLLSTSSCTQRISIILCFSALTLLPGHDCAAGMCCEGARLAAGPRQLAQAGQGDTATPASDEASSAPQARAAEAASAPPSSSLATPAPLQAPISELAGAQQQATLTTAGAPAAEVEGQMELEAVMLPSEGNFTLEVRAGAGC
jgi:hypothetical protein